VPLVSARYRAKPLPDTGFRSGTLVMAVPFGFLLAAAPTR